METSDVGIGTSGTGDTPPTGDSYAKGDARIPKVLGGKKRKKLPTFKRWLKESIDWDSLNYKYNGDEVTHRLDFFNNNGSIGYIEWDKDDGTVDKIYVGDKIRREGIGTYIWNTATEWAEENQELPPEHSSRRTKNGEDFAKSIGGNIPELTDDIDGWTQR